MGITSYNIRISATQSYVQNERKGRFNGIFQMCVTIGSMLGELVAGGMAEFMGKREVNIVFMLMNAIAVWAVIYRGKRYVKPIYNRQA